ncbi:MAG: PorT family protein [Dinghuibacter sp.]|nr:PorT family protein [Dinghuibacter sp.]
MKTLTTFLALALSFSAAAQSKKNFNSYYDRRVHIGAKAGANMTKIDGRGFSDGFKYGFHAGGVVQLKLAGRISLQAELLFSQTVADTARDLSEMVDFIRFAESRKTLRLNYLDIPFMLNIGLGDLKAIKLQLGGQYGILMNKSQTLLANGKNAFKSGQLSALAGIQIQLPFIMIGGRYTIGLDNLNAITTKSEWKSQTGQVFIGFTL